MEKIKLTDLKSEKCKYVESFFYAVRTKGNHIVEFLKVKNKGMLVTVVASEQAIDSLLEAWDKCTERRREAVNSFVETIQTPFHKILLRAIREEISGKHRK